MTGWLVHRRRWPGVVPLAAMNRALVVAALALVSAAGLGGCGGAPLGVDGGHKAQAGSAGAAGATGGAKPDSGLGIVVDGAAGQGTGGATTGAAGATPPGATDAGTADTRDAPAAAGKDGSAPDVAGHETPPTGWLTFDVTATVALKPAVGQAALWTGFPTTVRFPMAFSPARVFVLVAGIPLDAEPDGAGFRIPLPASVDTPFAGSCEGTATLDFETLSFSIAADGTLHGQGTGQVLSQIGADFAQVPATYSLLGGPDVTPPTLIPVTGTIDPLSPNAPQVSEVMAPGGAMTLVGTQSGDRFPLTPSFLDDDPTQPLLGFSLDNPVMLRWGEVYKVESVGVADLAGNAFAFATPPTQTTPPAPILQPENGFENAAGTMYGGGGVLKGGPLAAITGTTSLLVGNTDTFLSYKVGTAITVRLAVAPGDTVVRFDTRLFAPNQPNPDDGSGAFRGVMFVGAVGQEIQSAGDVIGDTFTMVSLAGGGAAWQSEVGTTEIPLPPGASGEVSLEILQEPFGPPGCGAPQQTIVMAVDNVRVE